MKKTYFISIISVFLFCFACKKENTSPITPIPTLTEEKTTVHKITIDGIEREFIVYQPSGVATDAKMPLVVMYHGSGGTHQKYYNISGWKEKAASVKCLVAFPQALAYCTIENGKNNTETKWHTPKLDTILCKNVPQKLGDDYLFSSKLVENIKANYAVDAHRVYATGFSNGGSFCAYLYDKTDNLFAAFNETGSISSFVTDIPQNNPPLLMTIGDSDPNFTEPFGIKKYPFDESFVTYPAIQIVLQGNLTPLKLKNQYTLTKTANSLLFTYNQTTDGVAREFNLMLLKDATHQYPNGTNHQFVMADFLWTWFLKYQIP